MAHTGKIIEFVVKEMTGRELVISRSKYCVGRMAWEMGIIADLQGGDSLHSSKDTTFSQDVTTVKGTHLNEVHTSTECWNLLLSISSLAGGIIEDYTKDILQTVSNIMENYSGLNNTDAPDVVKKAKESINNTLTDRVPVNHCVVYD